MKSNMTLKELQTQICEIRDNHLRHMKEDIDRIETKVEKMDTRLWWVLAILVSAVLIPVLKDLLN